MNIFGINNERVSGNKTKFSFTERAKYNGQNPCYKGGFSQNLKYGVNSSHVKNSFMTAPIADTNYDKFEKSASLKQTSFKGDLRFTQQDKSAEEISSLLKIASSAFQTVEANIVEPLDRILMKTGKNPVPIEKADDAYLSKLFKTPNTKDYLTGLFAAHIVRVVFDEEEKAGKDTDREFVFSYMKSRAEYEAEACRKYLDGTKRMMGIYSDTDSDLQILLYEKIAKACGILAKEIH